MQFAGIEEGWEAEAEREGARESLQASVRPQMSDGRMSCKVVARTKSQVDSIAGCIEELQAGGTTGEERLRTEDQ